MSNAFAAAHFQSPETAREWLEKLRWPEGPICSHCGTIGHAYKTKKPGWYRCAEKECRKDFTVTTGTVMERSHIPLNKWLMAFYLLNASKKGMSAHQLHRALNLDYKTAWFMCHRIREAMRSGGLGPLGGEGKIVEVDETYHGKTEKPRVSPQRRGRPYNPRGSRGPKDKRAIVSLVERGGNVRSFHVPVADQATVEKIVNENIAHEFAAAHRRKQALFQCRRYLCRTRNRHALQGRICAWRRNHEQRRRLLLDLQTRHEGHLPALQREAPSPLSRRVRPPLQLPCGARLQRHRPHPCRDQRH